MDNSYGFWSTSLLDSTDGKTGSYNSGSQGQSCGVSFTESHDQPDGYPIQDQSYNYRTPTIGDDFTQLEGNRDIMDSAPSDNSILHESNSFNQSYTNMLPASNGGGADVLRNNIQPLSWQQYSCKFFLIFSIQSIALTLDFFFYCFHSTTIQYGR